MKPLENLVTMQLARTVLTASLLMIAMACASGPTRYVHPNADLSTIKKVAVLPFENVSGAAGAADKVHKIFLVELLSLEVFEVVEPGQVSRAIKAESVASPDQLTPDDLKRIGTTLGADGLVMGQVVDYQDNRSSGGSAPEVTLQFRIVETNSGSTLWSASQTTSGVKTSSRLFGVSGDSLSEVTRKMIRTELDTLFQ